MANPHPLTDELNIWSDKLGAQAFADARKEYRKRYDQEGTPGEWFAFMVETRGTERIKQIWHTLHTMSGGEIFAGRNQD